MTYQAGDHLGVLPRNGFDTIRRVMARFGLDAGQYLTIIPNSGTHTHLPIEEPTPLLGVLGSCVELQDVATRDDIAVLARHTDDPQQKTALEAMTGDDDTAQAAYRERVYVPTGRCWTCSRSSRRATCRSRCTSTCCPPCVRGTTRSPHPPGQPRHLQHHGRGAQRTGAVGRRPFTGVCSGHLAHVPVDGTAFVFVRPPSIPFRPPENPHVPMIMIGAGTGLAPFRGFLQERAALRAQKVPVAPSLLLFGCRSAGADLLYADELASYEAQGLVRTELASRPSPGRAQVRAAGDARLRRRGVGPVAAGRSRPRVRERVHHRSGRPRVPDADLPGPDRGGRGE